MIPLIPVIAGAMVVKKVYDWATEDDLSVSGITPYSDDNEASLSLDETKYVGKLKKTDTAFDELWTYEIIVTNNTLKDYINVLSIPDFDPSDIGWDEKTFEDCKDLIYMEDKSALFCKLLGWNSYSDTISLDKLNVEYEYYDELNSISEKLRKIRLNIKKYTKQIAAYDELLKGVVDRNKSLIGECESYKSLSPQKREYIKGTAIIFNQLCNLLFAEFLLEDGVVNPVIIDYIKEGVIEIESIEANCIDTDGKIDDLVDIRKKTETFEDDFNLKILCDPDMNEDTLYLVAGKNDSEWLEIDRESNLKEKKCCRKFDFSERAYTTLGAYIDDQIDDGEWNSCTVYYAGDEKHLSELKSAIKNDRVTVLFIGNYSQFYR